MRLACFGILVLFGSVPAWSAALRGGSDYGISPLATCGTTGPINGVSATCYVGSGGFPNDFLFNFTLANPSPSITVTSFTLDFSDVAPSDYGLVVGPCPGGVPVPCASNYTISNPPPFDVIEALPNNPSSRTFYFTGFTGDQSGQVTVFLEYCDPSSPPRTCTPVALPATPTISDITATTRTGTPEPSTLVLSLTGIAFAWGVRRARSRR